MLCVGGLGLCVLLCIGNAFRWWSELATPRGRIREKLLRSPGDSLRRSLEQLNEYLIYSVAVFLLVPMLFAWQAPILSNLWAVGFLAGLLVLCALPGFCVIRLHRAYALSLRGQRAVGEEVNQLMLDNCRVFHDFPSTQDRNISHIVVAPSGVYAIETKTYRKRRARGQLRENEAISDGRSVQFPYAVRSAPIREARRNAATLAQELSGALAEPIDVKAVLALPGWQIARHSTTDVLVLNPKEIWYAIVTTAPPKLSPARMERIAYYLQQKCRDVEI